MLEFHIICIIWILCAGEGLVQSSEGGYVGVGQVSNTALDCAVIKLFQLKQSNIFSHSVGWKFCDH
jgi:hypothetical protein